MPAHGDGVWSDFFGRPAYTITLPVKVARQFDAIRIFAWGERSGRGWKVRAVEWTEPLTGDMQKDVDAMNRMIGSIIRRIPRSTPGATTAKDSLRACGTTAHATRSSRGPTTARNKDVPGGIRPALNDDERNSFPGSGSHSCGA